MKWSDSLSLNHPVSWQLHQGYFHRLDNAAPVPQRTQHVVSMTTLVTFICETGWLSLTLPMWVWTDIWWKFELLLNLCCTLFFSFTCFHFTLVSFVPQSFTSLPVWAGEDGEARHPHSGPPPEAGAAVRGVGEAADPEAQQRCAEDGWEAVPGCVDCQAAEDQSRSSHSHQVRNHCHDSLCPQRFTVKGSPDLEPRCGRSCIHTG